MASKYSQGRAFEWKVRDDLRSKGYDVGRTAGSKSPIDLFAVPRTGTGLLFVQCKLGSMSKAEKIVFYQFSTRAGADCLLATRRKEGRKYVIVYERIVFTGEAVECKISGRLTGPSKM
uniref:Putative holliday junction resolvase n=2 Tax=viral metagenome TaxID=1070528 RepID=A0A6M3KU99_9ZZZZ